MTAKDPIVYIKPLHCGLPTISKLDFIETIPHYPDSPPPPPQQRVILNISEAYQMEVQQRSK